MSILLRTPGQQEFGKIASFIREFELDNRNLHPDEFIAAFRATELLGFGRLRRHSDCLELCSLGVVTEHRRQGIGKALVTALVGRASQDLYLVCIIPGFFIPFGFRTVQQFPAAIADKLAYCNQELSVPEPYVVMRFFPGK